MLDSAQSFHDLIDPFNSTRKPIRVRLNFDKTIPFVVRLIRVAREYEWTQSAAHAVSAVLPLLHDLRALEVSWRLLPSRFNSMFL